MCFTNETCTERDANMTCERAYASSVPNHNLICRCKDKKAVFGGNSACSKFMLLCMLKIKASVTVWE